MGSSPECARSNGYPYPPSTSPDVEASCTWATTEEKTAKHVESTHVQALELSGSDAQLPTGNLAPGYLLGSFVKQGDVDQTIWDGRWASQAGRQGTTSSVPTDFCSHKHTGNTAKRSYVTCLRRQQSNLENHSAKSASKWFTKNVEKILLYSTVCCIKL